ncbi:MAG: hypothetical protein EP338_05730, partial [Bacteroidetes bacterium]
MRALLSLFLLFSCFNILYSQFGPVPFSANNSFRFFTPNTVDRIGFGNAVSFPNGSVLPSIITVNSNGLTFPTDETFRTNSPGTNNAAWRMFTGPGNGSERFSIYAQPNNNVFTQVSTAGGIYGIKTLDMISGLGGLRFLIMNDGPLGLNGRTAIGDNLPENFVAKDRLHLHHTFGASNVRVRFSYDGRTTDGLDQVGSGNSDGTVIGIDINGEYRIIQHEDRPIRYFIPRYGDSSGTVRRSMSIYPGGRTVIGVDAVGSKDSLNWLKNRLVIKSEWGPSVPAAERDATPSGLRFVNLTSNSSTVSNPGTGVLAL